jgi:hypothetical protein
MIGLSLSTLTPGEIDPSKAHEDGRGDVSGHMKAETAHERPLLRKGKVPSSERLKWRTMNGLDRLWEKQNVDQ